MSDKPDWIDELYAEGTEELPPPALDEKIRAAARQPVQHPWYRSPGRLTALATAASIVIAVSVLYLETNPSTLDAPSPELESQAAPSADSAAGRSDTERVDAAKSETTERKSTLMRQISNEAAEAPIAGAGAAPATAPADIPASAAPDQQPQRTGSSSLRAMEQDLAPARVEEAPVAELSDQAALLEKEPADELARLCGALPGTEETREITSDEAGWLVTVAVGSDVRTWRCVDGAWIEVTSEQQ
jgi:hypothetical protein